LNNDRLLALDFDGVIADSILECLVSAHNAFSKYQGEYDPREHHGAIPKSQVESFRKLRPQIRRGEDYVFILQSMAEDEHLATQSDFDGFINRNSHRREDYRDVFYQERSILRKNNLVEWLALNPIYPGLSNFLRGVFEKRACMIVTTKDLTSVRAILQNEGIEPDPADMFQATLDYRKPAIINDFIRKRKLNPRDISFIDDHVATVLEVAENTEVHTYCASWGYNTRDQLNTLHTAGHQSLKLDEFMERFKDFR
jgi:phosphoglycolate phosphatase-like HAD superfamily hydrolase